MFLIVRIASKIWLIELLRAIRMHGGLFSTDTLHGRIDLHIII